MGVTAADTADINNKADMEDNRTMVNKVVLEGNKVTVSHKVVMEAHHRVVFKEAEAGITTISSNLSKAVTSSNHKAVSLEGSSKFFCILKIFYRLITRLRTLNMFIETFTSTAHQYFSVI